MNPRNAPRATNIAASVTSRSDNNKPAITVQFVRDLDALQTQRSIKPEYKFGFTTLLQRATLRNRLCLDAHQPRRTRFRLRAISQLPDKRRRACDIDNPRARRRGSRLAGCSKRRRLTRCSRSLIVLVPCHKLPDRGFIKRRTIHGRDNINIPTLTEGFSANVYKGQQKKQLS